MKKAKHYTPKTLLVIGKQDEVLWRPWNLYKPVQTPARTAYTCSLNERMRRGVKGEGRWSTAPRSYYAAEDRRIDGYGCGRWGATGAVTR